MVHEVVDGHHERSATVHGDVHDLVAPADEEALRVEEDVGGRVEQEVVELKGLDAVRVGVDKEEGEGGGMSWGDGVVPVELDDAGEFEGVELAVLGLHNDGSNAIPSRFPEWAIRP